MGVRGVRPAGPAPVFSPVARTTDNAGADIDRLVRGDEAAWRAFVDRYAPVIYSAVWKVLLARAPAGGGWDAEDVAQSVFVRLVERDYRLLRSYDPGRASLVTWLTIIARSKTIDFLRRRALRTVPIEEHEDDVAVAPRRPASPLDLPGGVLTARQKLVLHLLYDREMDVKEAAAALGVDAQTVRSTRHKAVTRLRRYFARVDGGDDAGKKRV